VPQVPVASLVRIDLDGGEARISAGRAFLRSARHGPIEGPEHGLFVDETRILSRWRWSVVGRDAKPIAASPVEQHSWLGYLLVVPPAVPEDGGAIADAMGDVHADVGLELRVSRFLDVGLHEELAVTNWSGTHARLALELEIDADFASLETARARRPSHGVVAPTWDVRHDGADVTFRWGAEVSWSHQGDVGVTRATRDARVRVRATGARVSAHGDRLRFEIELGPKETWRARADVAEAHEVDRLAARFSGPIRDGCWDPRRDQPGTRIAIPDAPALATVALGAVERARCDLTALRLNEGGAETFAAGAPLYVALFGRDALTASWQSAMLDPAPMLGSLEALATLQGEVDDPWRDEEPGKMIHERHRSPTEVLHDRPMDRYYGSITTSAFFPVVVGEAWHWSGDLDGVRPFVDPALRALRWLDDHARRDDGFYVYRTRSVQGVRHQAWKDSASAIVRADGTDVAPPIATCEEQAFVHVAMLNLSELLAVLGRWDEARELRRKADELKQRFDEAFWMEDVGFFALGLDADGNRIDAIASNPGHVLAAGMSLPERVGPVAGRLMSDDMFSGWGVRTLSTFNPAFDPFSYHRGSVWPVENATFVLGFVRYGLHAHAERLARALFEASALFPSLRLPESFAGHPRDAEHPFPAIYPDACAPQAWSASAVICVLQALLGLYPYAPLGLLFVDPHLPAWLPRLRLDDVRVGQAKVSLSFTRDANGRTSYRVEALEGRLRVVRQPSPWSLTAGPTERIRDLLSSVRPRPRARSSRRPRA
jgi:glycogen debranching enzyme